MLNKTNMKAQGTSLIYDKLNNKRMDPILINRKNDKNKIDYIIDLFPF